MIFLKLGLLTYRLIVNPGLFDKCHFSAAGPTGLHYFFYCIVNLTSVLTRAMHGW